MQKDNRIAGLILLLIFGYSLCEALDFTKRAAYFPIFVSALGCLLSVILIASGFLSRRGKAKEKLSPEARKRVALSALGIVLYAVGIEYAGFSVSTFVFLVVMMIAGYRRKMTAAQALKIAAVCAALSAIVYVVFEKLLFVPLPHGLLI